MDLVEFNRDDPRPEVAGYLQTLHPMMVAELDFGVLAREADAIIGHILLATRPVTPILMGDLDLLDFKGEDTAKPILEAKIEAFVLTFEVKEDHRRQGIGTKLQLAAIEACRRRGLYQMRGWSSHNKPETYALKLKLGFAAVPGVQYIERVGKWVPGTYFVLPLE